MEYLVAPERRVGDGFVVRSYAPGDGALVMEAVNTSYGHLKSWMRWARPDVSVEDSERLVREFRGRYLLAQDFTLGIFSCDETRQLGGTGFHLREGPLGARCAEIGMWIRGSEAGKGLGTRVLQTLVSWGFEEWPWLRLSWRCDVRNVASARTAEKAGMHLEGVLRGQPAEVGEGRRDTACYGITREQWVAATTRSEPSGASPSR